MKNTTSDSISSSAVKSPHSRLYIKEVYPMVEKNVKGLPVCKICLEPLVYATTSEYILRCPKCGQIRLNIDFFQNQIKAAKKGHPIEKMF